MRCTTPVPWYYAIVAERRGDVFPATSIDLVGYNEDLYQLLMEKKAYEYKTSSYEGRVWEGES